MNLSSWAITWLVKGSCFLPVLFGFATLVRRATASDRHRIWTVGLAVVIALPLIPRALQRWQVQLPLFIRPGDVSGALGPSLVAGLLVWSLGCALLLLRFGICAIRLERLVVRARPASPQVWPMMLSKLAARLEVTRLPRVFSSEEVSLPLACGVLRPAIVLPSSWEEWSSERLGIVLSHELAHVKRHDVFSQTLGHLACALYWFHPLSWRAAQRLRAEGERSCDEMVLSLGVRPSVYAGQLLQMATADSSTSLPAHAIALAGPVDLEDRIATILDPSARRGGPGRAVGWLLTPLIAVCAAPLFVLSAVLRSGPDQRYPEAVVVAAAPAAATRAVLQGGSTKHRVGSPPGSAPQSTRRHGPSATLVNAGPAVPGVSSANASVRLNVAVVRALTVALEGDRDPKVRALSVWALVHRGSANVDGPALQALRHAAAEDESADVRASASWAVQYFEAWPVLESLALASSEEDLVAIASDPESTIRQTADWTLQTIGKPFPVPAIADALIDGDPAVRAAAVVSVAQIARDPVTLKALTRSQTVPSG